MSDEERLMVLLDSWHAAVAAGEKPSVAEFCRHRPDLIGPLEKCIAADGLTGSTDGYAGNDPTTIGPKCNLVQTGSFDGLPAAPAADVAAPVIGESFAGFKLLSVLGEGGFGMVFRAEDLQLHRKVALKVLNVRALARPHARASFLAEARALASVQHDHVVPIFQVGEERGQPYLAMPLLGGETLAARIEREGALPSAEVRRIGREAALGLSALHARGLVHRDLKPANLWLEAGTGRVKVLDLGLAQDSLATGDSIAGTPPYMSPEQAAGQELDFRSDLFSLGTVLYKCASGRQPFRGQSLAETLRIVREESPPTAARANPAVPGDVSTLIERLHRKNPAERPVSAILVAEQLAETASPTARQVPPSKLGVWITAGLAALLIVAAGIWLAVRVMNPPTVATSPGERIPVPSLASVRYQGKLDVLVERDAQLLRLNEAGALPLRQADKFRIEGDVDPPAYLYVVWIDPDHDVTPVYPWNAAKGWGSRPATEQPAGKVSLPSNVGNRYTAPAAKPGVATMVLFATTAPLTESDDVIKG